MRKNVSFWCSELVATGPFFVHWAVFLPSVFKATFRVPLGTLSSPPTPPHPTSCVAPNILRSINHVSKFKERYHHPPPHPTSCVASTMLASSRNVIITPTPPNILRTINHVSKFKERYHPHPPHPQISRKTHGRLHAVYQLLRLLICPVKWVNRTLAQLKKPSIRWCHEQLCKLNIHQSRDKWVYP